MNSAKDVVRIEKLQETAQSASWKFQMRVALRAKELLGVANGEEVRPVSAATEMAAAEVTAANTAVAPQNKKDARLQNIIVTSLGPKKNSHKN